MKKLIKQFEELHQLAQQLPQRERAALNYLEALPKEYSTPQVDGLVTLLKSITSLRQLAHVQLSEIVRTQVQSSSERVTSTSLPPQDHHQISSSNPQDTPALSDIPPALSSELTQDVGQDSARGASQSVDQGLDQRANQEASEEIEEDAFETAYASEVDGIFYGLETRVEESPLTPSQPEQNAEPPSPHLTPRGDHFSSASSQDESDSLHDELDLMALQREVESLTQPAFDGIGHSGERDGSPVKSLLPNKDDKIPDFMNHVSELGDIDNSDITPPIGSTSGTDNSHNKDALLNREDETPLQDIGTAFPVSSGEAGTAIFDASMLEMQGLLPPGASKLQSEPQPEPPQAEEVKPQSVIYASVITPDVSFEGEVESLDKHTIFVQSVEQLHRGEQVELSFTLPQSQQRISCSALVRTVRTIEEAQARGLKTGVGLRFLNLRPQQESLITQESLSS